MIVTTILGIYSHTQRPIGTAGIVVMRFMAAVLTGLGVLMVGPGEGEHVPP